MVDTIKKRFMAKDMSESNWIAAIKQSPKNLIASNSKLSKSGIYQFSLPAFKAAIVINGQLTNLKTCPNAGECGKFCYSSQGTFIFSNVMIAHTRNLQFYIDNKELFISRMINEIGKIRNLKAFRFHDSGDAYSREYAIDCFKIMNALPHIQFYAYTKMIPLYDRLKREGLVPKNFSLIYSFGGKFDYLIDTEVDRHSKVFESHEDMMAAGYSDTTETDDNAADPSKRCVGLVYHGKSNYRGSAVGKKDEAVAV